MAQILFLAHRIPYPPNKGDKIRSWHILEYLAKRHTVHLGCFIDDSRDWEHVDFLKSICASTHFSGIGPIRSKLRSLKGVLGGSPLSVACYKDRNFDAWVAKTLTDDQIDAVFLFSSAMGRFMQGRFLPGLPVIMDFVDIDSDKWAQYAGNRGWPMNWVYRRESRTLMAFERKLARQVTAGLFVSAHEADLFRRKVPEFAEKIDHMNNGVDCENFSPDHRLPSPYTGNAPRLVFTGAMDYWANVDAVIWFATRIFPIVRTTQPECEFYIVGGKPSRQVRDLARLPGITVTGRVPDVRPYLAHSDVVVCPLRIARGIQNKVLEGMAMAKPVAATSAAFEGISATPGKELEVADTPEEFAQHIIRLFDKDTGMRMGSLARKRILAEYGWAQNLEILDRLIATKNVPSVTALQPLRRIN